MFKSLVRVINDSTDFLVDHITPNDYASLVFPENIHSLVIAGDYLDELVIPEGVRFACVSELSLRKLVVPDSVIWLNCEDNCLRELELPGGIEYVDAHNNFLTRLEFRKPPTELGVLNVENNRLRSLDFEVTSNLYGLNTKINSHNDEPIELSPSLKEFLATHEW